MTWNGRGSLRQTEIIPLLPPLPTYGELARAAGVSLATVDRVMNDRPGVRARTRQRVLDVWQRLQVDTPAVATTGEVASPAMRPRIDILLPSSRSGFGEVLTHAFQSEALDHPEIDLHLHMAEPPEKLAARGQRPEVPEEARAIGLIAADHPYWRNWIAGLMGRGIPVVTIASDILGVEKTGYVGVDNLSAGRLAGHLMCQLLRDRPGRSRIAAIRGATTLRGQFEREMGLRQKIQEAGDSIEIVAIEESIWDDTDAATARILSANPDVTAIYNMTGGNRGVIAALRAAGRTETVAFVGHDLTPHTRDALLSGAMDFVIDQDVAGIAREALRALTEALAGHKPVVSQMPLHIYTSENLPGAGSIATSPRGS